ncbi:MAG: glucose-1-phosphate thymidylyltransferase [Verrucomicrobiales bacterium]|jgi:glucose-1-phosphate thymidylyltransferase
MTEPSTNVNHTRGIVLAGGAGTRLDPLTRLVCKQLLPVYDKPMVNYPISVLMLGGIREIMIISTPKDLPHFKELFGDGSQYGCRFEYAEQPEPKGIAQAFLIGSDFIGDSKVSLILGDNLFYGRLTFFREALKLESGGHIFAYRVRDPERFGIVEFDDEGKVVSIEEKPQQPKSPFAVPGLYVYDETVVERCRALAPSSRDELEITDLNLSYMKDGALQVSKMSRGVTWLDTGTPDSLLEAGQYIATIQHQMSAKIACLEEIAFTEGFIDQRQMEALVDSTRNPDHREYLRGLLE